MYWAVFLVRMLSWGKLHINPVHCRDSTKVTEWMNEGMKTTTLNAHFVSLWQKSQFFDKFSDNRPNNSKVKSSLGHSQLLICK